MRGIPACHVRALWMLGKHDRSLHDRSLHWSDDHRARVYGAVRRERARADARGQPRARAAMNDRRASAREATQPP